MIAAALIDLDGTLLDTVDDIAAAGNATLAEMGRAPISRDTAGSYIGRGAQTFVARMLTGTADGTPDPDELERWMPRFMHHYARENGRHATRFERVDAGLDALRALGLRLACVTNKPRALTLALLAQFGLDVHFDAVVAGGDTERKKPDPQPLHVACERLGVTAARAVMIGDSINDAQAGRAAGCAVLLVPYGYAHGAPVETAGADAIVPTLVDAAHWIAARNAPRSPT